MLWFKIKKKAYQYVSIYDTSLQIASVTLIRADHVNDQHMPTIEFNTFVHVTDCDQVMPFGYIDLDQH